MPNPFSSVASATSAAPVSEVKTLGAPSRAHMAFGKAESNFVKITDYAGELLAVYPTAFEEAAIKIDGEDVDGVRVDFLVASGDDAGTEHKDALVIGKILRNALKRKIGEAVILKIGQGQKKGARQAPWIPLDTTPEEDAHVAKVVASVYK